MGFQGSSVSLKSPLVRNAGWPSGPVSTPMMRCVTAPDMPGGVKVMMSPVSSWASGVMRE